jgi:chromatin structure-remodeling complex subunit RSC1/2
MALQTIIKKISSKEIKSMDDLEADLNQIVENAKEYNIEGSDVYIQAEELEAYYLNLLGKGTVGKVKDDFEKIPVDSISAKGQKYVAGTLDLLS